MTEAEWQTFTDLEVPLRGGLDLLAEQTGTPPDERKLRLFLAACVRRVSHVFRDSRTHSAIDTTERFADGLITWGEWVTADEHVINPPNPDFLEPETWPPQQHPGYCAIQTLNSAGQATIDCFTTLQGARWSQDALGEHAKAEEEIAQAAILRDIFGPLPFRLVTINPVFLTWQNGTIPKLAEAAYEDRVLPAGTLLPARLLVLSDALEDAGCTDAVLLSHLRSSGSHVRGCWALDLILLKGR